MNRLLRSLCLLIGAMLLSVNVAASQDLPPLEILRAIAAKLPHRPQTRGTTFERSGTGAVDPVCRMQHFTMTLATGSAASRSLPVLLDHMPAAEDTPVTLMAVLHRLTVDADGSPRTYHPDDPHGKGTCASDAGPDGTLRYRGVCALDGFASAHLLVFHGTQKLAKGEFETPWQGIWPLIRAKTLKPIDLKQFVPTAPAGFYFFYWKERNLSAFFKREIIAQAPDGYPCRSDDGYFIAATTLKEDGAACASSRFMDAEKRPFLVLPDDAFGNARVGDLVVGRLAGAAAERVVFGVVGDTGPIAQFGEASIAFNRALLGSSAPIMNERDVDALDISGGPVTLLVLGGTGALLRGDYSRHNVERVGRAEFARWSGAPSRPMRRLDACIREFGAK